MEARLRLSAPPAFRLQLDTCAPTMRLRLVPPPTIRLTLGQRGPQGIQGVQGEQGEQGIQGLPGNDATLTNNSVTNAILADMAANTIKLAVSAGDPIDGTPAQARTVAGLEYASAAEAEAGTATNKVITPSNQLEFVRFATPLVARARGIKSGTETFSDNTYKTVNPGFVVFDTDPNRVASTTSGLIVIAGTGSDVPTGNFYLREPGYYRMKAKIYWTTTASGGVSTYLALVDLGPTGAGSTTIEYANEEQPTGQHPSLSHDMIVRITAANYFNWKARYIASTPGAPATLNMVTDVEYTSFEVEYLGGL